MQTFSSRHIRACKNLAFIAALICLPLGFLYYWHHQDAPHPLLLRAPTPPFIWMAKTPQSAPSPLRFFSHESLLGGVHLAYFVPEPQHAHAAEHEAFKRLSHSLDSELTAAPEESKDYPPLRRILIAAGGDIEALAASLMDSGHSEAKASSWRLVPHHPWVMEDMQKMLNAVAIASGEKALQLTLSQPFLMLWDYTGQISGYISQNQLLTSQLELLQRVVSLVFFHGSMAKYLKERTFFGRKKDAS